MGVYLRNSTFYHIPRTGGSWVTKVLCNMGGKILRKYRDGVDSFLNRGHAPPTAVRPDNFSFAFVRHPLDWYKSVWLFRTRRDGKWRHYHYCKFSAVCGRDDFNDFIDAVIENYPEGYYNKIVKEFSSVDFMGRYENLKDDLIRALDGREKFDKEMFGDYPRLNVSRRMDLIYTPGQMLELSRMEREVISKYYGKI